MIDSGVFVFTGTKHGIIAQFSCQSDNFTLYRTSIAFASRAASKRPPTSFERRRKMTVSAAAVRASDKQLADAIRALAMDAVEAAKSGHPGMPMGMAEIAVALWNRHLRHNPKNPHWPNRDRFMLSNGHGSMLQYALLHLSGYDLPDGRASPFPATPLEDAGPSRSRRHPRRRDDHGAARTGPGQRRRHGARGKAAGRAIQPAGPRGRRSSHLRLPGRRLPDGRHFARSVLARRHLAAGQTHRDLRRQRHIHRRPCAGMVHRRHAAALRGLRLARHRQRRRARRGRRRCRDRGRESGDRQAHAHLLQDDDRQRRADQGRHRSRPRRRIG